MIHGVIKIIVVIFWGGWVEENKAFKTKKTVSVFAVLALATLNNVTKIE
jgi:hypothetical protein